MVLVPPEQNNNLKLTKKQLNNFSRHLILEDFGEKKQNIIFNSHITFIAVGGITCPAIIYLLSMGIKNITIVDLQKLMFKRLGFTDEQVKDQFGFLMESFEYGAPPHGGVAFGFDRLCSIMGGKESIRDFIAFPKNNSGRDVMIELQPSISVTVPDSSCTVVGNVGKCV